jgi:hypothetical protein
MMIRRTAIAAAFAALLGMSAPHAADAQNYGGGYGGGYGGQIPLMQAATWSETEDGGWNGIWTFEMGSRRRTMSAVWTNNQTGRHSRARGMMVQRRGQQIIITRPGFGNYVGTISPDGRSLEGTLSWSSGRFRARAQ